MNRGAGRRHRGRELALRVLFELEGTDKDADAALDYQSAELGATSDIRGYARQLVAGCLGDMEQIDAGIGRASTNWHLADIGKVERAVLRLGAYELLDEPEVPTAVVIDESIELAKTYAGDEAGAFVNGVLGRLARERSSP